MLRTAARRTLVQVFRLVCSARTNECEINERREVHSIRTGEGVILSENKTEIMKGFFMRFGLPLFGPAVPPPSTPCFRIQAFKIACLIYYVALQTKKIDAQST